MNSNPTENVKIVESVMKATPNMGSIATSGPTESTMSTPIASLPTGKSGDYSIKKTGPPFWTQNPNILFDKEYLTEFFPTSDMTLHQKLNAITRLVIILTIISISVTANPIRIVFIGFLSVLAVIGMFEYYKGGEGFSIGNKSFDENGMPNPAVDYLADLNAMDTKMPLFQQPSPTNPYGNVLVSDYELNPEKLPAPPISNPIVNNMVTENAVRMVQEANPGQPDIANKLFRDINEQLNFEQMNRQFISNPATTIPNDQGAFAEFCYGSMISCKDGNLFACARNTSHYTNY